MAWSHRPYSTMPPLGEHTGGDFRRQAGLADALRTEQGDEAALAPDGRGPVRIDRDQLLVAAGQQPAAGIEVDRQRTRRPRPTRRQQPDVVVEDRGLEMPERRARLDPHVVDQRSSRPLVRSQRLRLPSHAVEAEHQLLPEALAQGMFDDQGLQFGNQCDVRPERQFGVVAQLDGRQTQGVEAATLLRAQLHVVEAVVRPAAPQLQGGPQVCRVAGAAGGAIDERFESTGIDPSRRRRRGGSRAPT